MIPSCPVCGTHDRTQTGRCYRPNCPDGRGWGDGRQTYTPGATVAAEVTALREQLAEARAERDAATDKLERLKQLYDSANHSLRSLFGEDTGTIVHRAMTAESRAEAAEKEAERLRLPEGTIAKHGSTITIEFGNAEYALRAFDAIEYAMSREPAAVGERP